MTIHSEHPFATPEGERDPVRRLRGRVGARVSLWTAGEGADRAGLTVSSYVVATGEPAHLLGLLHPDSELLERLEDTGTAVVQLLDWRHRSVADVFAGLLPAPGGPFRDGRWEQTPWGPHLADATTWAGVRLERDGAAAPRELGWSVLVDVVVEHAEAGEDGDPLVHRRGRYQRPAGGDPTVPGPA